MAKEKKKLELPSASDVPNAGPILKEIAARQAKVKKAREAATEGETVKTADPAYRAARKKLKRSQRRLRRERVRIAQLPKPKEAAAPAASTPAESPTEAPEPAEQA
jgi:hypothetical protein